MALEAWESAMYDLRCIAAEKKAENDAIEACGLLVNVGDKWDVLELPNYSKRPSSFNMSQQDLYEVWLKHGDAVVGCWHTHFRDSTQPSELDVAEFDNLDKLRYFIVTVHGVYEWEIIGRVPIGVGYWDGRWKEHMANPVPSPTGAA